MASEWTILIAEDNAAMVLLVAQAIRRAEGDCRPQVVGNGRKVLEYLQGAGAYTDRNAFPFPDILLLDLVMPEMDGFEVLRWLQQEWKGERPQVFVFSDSEDPKKVDRAYELGAELFLVKPKKFEDLITLLRQIILLQFHERTDLETEFLRTTTQP